MYLFSFDEYFTFFHSTCINGKFECVGESCEEKCTENQFQCNDNTCINNMYRCDHHMDCKDGSDEANCSKYLLVEAFLFAVLLYVFPMKRKVNLLCNIFGY